MQPGVVQSCPSRALPFTELMIYALAQLAAENAWWDTAVLLILGFHVFPRSAELFSARKVDFVFDSRRQAVWSLPLTKSGQRVGAKESLIVEDAWIVDLLKQFLHPLMAGDRLSTVSAQGQRQRLKRLLKAASLEGDYRWYSCRRGSGNGCVQGDGQHEPRLPHRSVELSEKRHEFISQTPSLRWLKRS